MCRFFPSLKGMSSSWNFRLVLLIYFKFSVLFCEIKVIMLLKV